MIKLNYTPKISELNHEVQGIVPLKNRALGYADDLCAILNINSRDIVELDKVLTNFGKLSGLKLNKKKTVLCCLNEKWENLPLIKRNILETGFSLGASDLFILGHTIALDREQDLDALWNPVQRKINSTLFKANSLNLTLGGKLAVIKTFCLGAIAFTARVAPIPAPCCSKIAENLSNFINNGRVKFSEANIFSPISQNGLGIPDIKSFCSALLSKNLSRYLKTNKIWSGVLRAKFLNGQPDRCMTDSRISASLKVSADELSSAAVKFYSKWPTNAPLFYSPFLKLKCPLNQLGGPPPNCPAELLEVVKDKKICHLISNNFSLTSLAVFLGYCPGYNFFIRLKGGM